MLEFCQIFYQKYLSKSALKIFGRFTPNQITGFNLAFTILFGWLCFSQGTYLFNLLGFGVLLINGYLDYLDGDLAKSTKQFSVFGQWLDSGCDMIIQNIVMAAIAYGLCRTHALLIVAITFFIANSAMQVISLRYNATFGFDSHCGNALFRTYMDKKPNLFNKLMKNLLDPTASKIGFFLFTFRYWLVLGILFNQMKWAFIVITALLLFKVIIMHVIYGMHLLEYKKLWILQALAIIDEEREEYYKIRS